MTAGLTPTEVAALRRLYANATLGDWKLWGMTVMADQDGTSNVDTAVEVAQTFYRDENGKPRTWDADLICHMQRALPALIDAAYDDTGQPWRHRAEEAEESREVWMRMAIARGDERDEARATIDRVRALADEWESNAHENVVMAMRMTTRLRRVLAGDQEAT